MAVFASTTMPPSEASDKSPLGEKHGCSWAVTTMEPRLDICSRSSLRRGCTALILKRICATSSESLATGRDIGTSSWRPSIGLKPVPASTKSSSRPSSGLLTCPQLCCRLNSRFRRADRASPKSMSLLCRYQAAATRRLSMHRIQGYRQIFMGRRSRRKEIDAHL